MFPLGPQHVGNIPACRVYHDANQSITHNTVTTLALNSERYDDPEHPMHDASANNSRITFPVPGIYSVVGQVDWASSAVGERWLAVHLNGATYIARDRRTPIATSEHVITTQYRFTAGDYIELRVYQNSGGGLNVTAQGNWSPEFSATWLCP